MQELSVQPTNPTPYTPAGGVYNNNPVPGAGGLPSLSGLTRNVNPMANELQSQGRGEDSVLVHMTPNEVNSLRGLAQKFGGDLTTNPNTGLPEAGFLSKILPTLLGVGLSFIPGVGPLAAAGIVGAGTTAVTGDLQKGLMAGLGAFGGASAAGALQGAGAAGATGAGAANTVGSAGAAGAGVGANAGITAAENAFLTQAGGSAVPAVAAPASSGILGKFGTDFAAASREGLKAGTLPYKLAPTAAGIGVLGTASDVFQPEMPTYEKEEDKWNYEGPYLPMPRRMNPRATGSGEISFFEPSNPYPGYLTRSGGLPSGFAEGGDTDKKAREAVFTTPAMPAPTMGAQLAANLPKFISQFQTSPGPITASRTYEGGSPIERIRAAAKTNAAAAPKTEMDFGFAKTAGTAPVGGFGGPDYSGYITDYFAKYGYPGMRTDISQSVFEYAKGGVHMDNGSFVVDARTVSELGNGSSSAGQELLARLGGRPVKGPGDGVSDSIPANIGGKQKARVARDEVIFPAKAVKRLGGAKKLYALMDKAHKARKKAKRGSDTKLRKGLGAL